MRDSEKTPDNRQARTRWLAAAGAALALAACASGTSFTSIWSNPEARSVTLNGEKVAAVVVAQTQGARRTAEDVLAHEITRMGGTGVAAYTILSEADTKDKEKAKAAFERAGIKGAVVMRVVQAGQQVTYQPGVTYVPGVWSTAYYQGGFWGYYGYGWAGAYDPGYLKTETTVQVETTVYGLVQDKLLWAAVSTSTNPSNTQEIVQKLAGTMGTEMKKAGLLK